MKRVVPKKNLLKNLIFLQENKTITRRTVEGMFRAFVEPILNSPQEGLVVYRLLDKAAYQGLLSRLKYIDVKLIDYTKDTAYKQDVWENTEFLCILTQRYGIVFIWDFSLEAVDGYAGYYLKFNSRLLDDGFNIINDNSKISLKKYMEKFRPDRRDNDMLNSVMLNLFDMYNTQTQEVIAVDLEREEMDKTIEEQTGYDKKTRYIAHEIKNQLSICELYAQIIRKYCEKNEIASETIENAVNSIIKAAGMANNNLISLKTVDENKLEPCKVKELIKEAISLAGVYIEGKGIELHITNNTDAEILADKNKFISVLINLIKNAAEAFNIEEAGDDENNKNSKEKFITLSTELEDMFVKILVTNNGNPVKDSEKIFDEGYTTKTTGSGLGLVICKKDIEDQFGQIKLIKSDNESTEFEISMGIV